MSLIIDVKHTDGWVEHGPQTLYSMLEANQLPPRKM